MNVIQGARKLLISASAAGLVVSASAVTISVDRVQQRYPWNGLVDIDYTIAELPAEENPLDYRIEVTITATTNDVPLTIVASNFATYAWCDLPTANGRWRATWNSTAEGAQFAANDLAVNMKLFKSPVSKSEADFLVVDLSAGSGADATYPVRYVRAPYAKTSYFNNRMYKKDRLVLKRVPAGTFWMGAGNVSSGTNRHRVQLTEDYFLGIFELTLGQYKNVMGRYPYQLVESWTAAVDGAKDYGPVIYESWNALMAENGVISLLNGRTLHGDVAVAGFNLPTEAQWERACRAECEYTYYWGSDSYADSSLYLWPSTLSHTYEVGLKRPNDWGFYDMYSNAFESCLDGYADYPAYDEETVIVNPTGDDTAAKRVLRGSTVMLAAANTCQSGARSSEDPSVGRAHNSGIRLACPIR